MFLRAQLQRLGLGDTLGDFVLDLEDVLQVGVVLLRPQVIAVFDIDELGGDAQPAVGLLHAAFEDCVDGKLPADLADIVIGVPELERRGS